MKINYWIYLLVLCCVGCQDFLEEDPESLITTDEFLQIEGDAQAMVNAIYHHINSKESIYTKYYWLVNDLMSDLGEYEGNDLDLREFSHFQISPSNRIVHELWKGLYAGIGAANYAIIEIGNTPVSAAEAETLVAEARFLRGMFYFDLVRYFGEVPLVVDYLRSPNEALVAKAPLDSLYALIEADFTFAFEHLPRSSSNGRPGGLAAVTQLGKYYATVGTYSRAAQALRVGLSGSAGLLADYNDLFRIANQNNAEILLSVNLGPNEGGPMNLLTLPRPLNGREEITPTTPFVELFSMGDRRREVTLIETYVDQSGNTRTTDPLIGKYWDPSVEPVAMPTANDIPLIRFADALLLQAEVGNELRAGSNAETLGAINAVRARSRTVPEALPDLGTLNKENFLNAILDERMRELAWEGQRWFDLVRTGTLAERVMQARGIAISEKDMRLPIPAPELELNPGLLPQNPGY